MNVCSTNDGERKILLSNRRSTSFLRPHTTRWYFQIQSDYYWNREKFTATYGPAYNVIENGSVLFVSNREQKMGKLSRIQDSLTHKNHNLSFLTSLFEVKLKNLHCKTYCTFLPKFLGEYHQIVILQ